MINAAKSPAWTWIGGHLIRWSLSRRFRRIYVRLAAGSENFGAPAILCPNHSYYWDAAIMGFVAEDVLKLDCYPMVKSQSMRQYRILQRVGCFEMDASTPIEASRSIEYAASLIRDQEHRCLLIFPQGDIRRRGKRPLEFLPGFAYVARRVGHVAVVPVALHYEEGEQRSAEAFVSIGKPTILDGQAFKPRVFLAEFEQLVIAELDALDRAVACDNLEDYRVVLERNAYLPWLNGEAGQGEVKAT